MKIGYLLQLSNGSTLGELTEELKAKVSELRDLNQAVLQAEIALTAALRKRNAIFYKGEGNLFLLQWQLGTTFTVCSVQQRPAFGSFQNSF